jgi:carbon-monoxide dehydrogenase medium subunit
MKPAPFDYIAPSSVEEAIEALQAAEEGKVLAGGQSLVPLMSLRLARPTLVVDINRIQGLESVAVHDGVLRLGAMVRHRRVAADPGIVASAPLLAYAARFVGHPAIRNRGTLGGSIAHADPASELAAALLALGGSVVARGPGGERAIAVADLFHGYFMTALDVDEVLTEVRVPARRPGEGYAFAEFAPRNGDFAVVAVAASVLRREEQGAAVRLVGAGLGGMPVDLSAAGDPALGERELTPPVLRSIAERVGSMVEPTGDIHATAEDRRELAQLLTARALREAWHRTAGD